MDIFQIDNVKIHQAQIVKEWRNIFTFESPLSHWDVLKKNLQSAGQSTRSWPKMYAPLDGNKCCDVIVIFGWAVYLYSYLFL